MEVIDLSLRRVRRGVAAVATSTPIVEIGRAMAGHGIGEPDHHRILPVGERAGNEDHSRPEPARSKAIVVPSLERTVFMACDSPAGR
nr:hypothetical protein [Kribbella capetownensis]